jgi:methyl-accepting chemotaxis protein
MPKIKSVNTLLAIQIALIVSPLACALGYQTISDALQARRLERSYALGGLSDQAQKHFQTFKNGASDAVDTGRLGSSSIEALKGALADLIALSNEIDDEGMSTTRVTVESMLTKLQKDPSLATLGTMRTDVGAADRFIGSMAKSNNDANATTLRAFLTYAHKQVWVMIAIAIATMTVIAVCARHMMRGVSQPLARAQAVAQEIAHGTLRIEAYWTKEKDLGGLLHSLGFMNDGLRDIIWGTQQAAEVVTASSGKVILHGRDVSEAINEQFQKIGLTRTTFNEMSGSIIEVNDAALATLKVAERVQDVAKQGHAKMAENKQATERIIKSVDSSATAINTLSNSIAQIADITKIIKEIADQTNLLALNAAIEAARAGEQGRGFAVVADEVRKLAERTSSSTSDIGSMVSAINRETMQVVQAMESAKTEVQQGAEHSRATGEYLAQIVTAAEEVFAATQEINAISSSQHHASEKAIAEMGQIAALAEQTAGKISEVNSGIDSLERTATHLAEMVNKFKVV